MLGTGDFTLRFGDFALGGIGTATFGAILLYQLFRDGEDPGPLAKPAYRPDVNAIDPRRVRQ